MRLAHSQVVRDSADVRIVDNPLEALVVAAPFSIDGKPHLVIGPDVEGGAFYRVRGAAQLADGRIVVLDGGTQELRVFDPAGILESVSGGKGPGPGELIDAAIVPAVDYDQLVVVSRDGKVTVFTSGLRDVRDFRIPGRTGVPLGVISDTKFVDAYDQFVLDPGTRPGIYEVNVDIRLVDFVSGLIDTVGTFPSHILRVGAQEGRRYVSRLSIDVMASGAPGREYFVFTHGESQDILRFDASQRLRLIIRSPAETLDALESLPAQPWRQNGHVGPSLSYYQSLIVDHRENVWAELARRDSTFIRRAIVFDSTGHALGNVSLPPSLDIQQIGEDFVLGISRDSSGIEYVHRYHLHRRAVH